jgi:U32 family peptidase
MNLPKLLAPAGNWECARAAMENGADAIYFGLEQFNARLRADNFTVADLPEVMAELHRRGVKGFVTLNTLAFTSELPAVERYLRAIVAAGVDAAIVQDVGICRLIRHLSADFPIHASTQMTVTSAAGVKFARDLGCDLVVLARECSLTEIAKIRGEMGRQGGELPLEVFVHGALCVAYSGQCLTSEALGGRSANRGECAQACRLPYDLVVDGELADLGDRRYLLSPQDLAGLSVLPDLVAAGVSCLKIEGRLKSPEYVAGVTRVYRQALDRLAGDVVGGKLTARDGLDGDSTRDRYQLEMAFSRGLYSGWFEGINNRELVPARFGKKRGVYLGEVSRVTADGVVIGLLAPLKLGDGVVFDSAAIVDKDREEGGRIYGLESWGKETLVGFGKGQINWRRVRVGDRLWKTSDPDLDRRVRQTYAGEQPQYKQPIEVAVYGDVDVPLIAVFSDKLGNLVKVESGIGLVAARERSLDEELLMGQFGRLGNTPFYLERVENHLIGKLMLPPAELNRLRREAIASLEARRMEPKVWMLRDDRSYRELLPNPIEKVNAVPEIIVAVRYLSAVETVLDEGIKTIYCEFEDPRKYRQAVEICRRYPAAEIFIATPRIAKPGENWILDSLKKANPDGFLIRNYDRLADLAEYRCRGDFSLNIANPLTARYFKETYPHLETLSASYDLNARQLLDLIQATPPEWWEVTVHQHVPMFHMEHCVFCAFLSTGTDFTNCGRPCEEHQVKLRDRTGIEHVLQADVACRNTIFNGIAQTGAEAVRHLCKSGLQRLRIEFLEESPQTIVKTIAAYRQLLQGKLTGTQLWQQLKVSNQLGITRGTIL